MRTLSILISMILLVNGAVFGQGGGIGYWHNKHLDGCPIRYLDLSTLGGNVGYSILSISSTTARIHNGSGYGIAEIPVANLRVGDLSGLRPVYYSKPIGQSEINLKIAPRNGILSPAGYSTSFINPDYYTAFIYASTDRCSPSDLRSIAMGPWDGVSSKVWREMIKVLGGGGWDIYGFHAGRYEISKEVDVYRAVGGETLNYFGTVTGPGDYYPIAIASDVVFNGVDHWLYFATVWRADNSSSRHQVSVHRIKIAPILSTTIEVVQDFTFHDFSTGLSISSVFASDTDFYLSYQSGGEGVAKYSWRFPTSGGRIAFNFNWEFPGDISSRRGPPVYDSGSGDFFTLGARNGSIGIKVLRYRPSTNAWTWLN